jgi:hypothetical protein
MLRYLVASWRRTYDVLAVRLGSVVLAGAVGVNLDDGPGRVATQTLTFMLTPASWTC